MDADSDGTVDLDEFSVFFSKRKVDRWAAVWRFCDRKGGFAKRGFLSTLMVGRVGLELFCFS